MPLLYYFSLGSNSGDRMRMLSEAVRELQLILEQVVISPVYETDAVDMLPGTASFYNLVLKGSSELAPLAMLDLCEAVERSLGRQTKRVLSGRYSDRCIDIDILIAGKRVIENERLTIPHPEMLKRGFVLIPFQEIDPGFIHPVGGLSIDEYVKKMRISAGVRQLDIPLS